jgi:hypothetical protein
VREVTLKHGLEDAVLHTTPGGTREVVVDFATTSGVNINLLAGELQLLGVGLRAREPD